MKDTERIQEEVEKTLNSLDADGVLDENPYLITRILGERESRLLSAQLRLASGTGLRYAAIALLLLMNLMTALFFARSTKSDADDRLVTALKEDLQIDQSQDNF
jgi:hypothetical protein